MYPTVRPAYPPNPNANRIISLNHMAVAVVFASALAFVAPPVHVAGPQFACATAQQPAALQMNLLGRAVKIPGSVVSSLRTMFKNAGSAFSSSGGVSDTAPSVSAPAIEI